MPLSPPGTRRSRSQLGFHGLRLRRHLLIPVQCGPAPAADTGDKLGERERHPGEMCEGHGDKYELVAELVAKFEKMLGDCINIVQLL